MSSFTAPNADYRFLLNDLLKVERFSNLPGFADATPDVVDAILEESGRIASEVLYPINETGDREGCTYNAEDHSVKTPTGFKEAYQVFSDGGWVGLTSEPDYGGQGLPFILGAAVNETFNAANWAFAMYPGLSHGAYSALLMHGSDELKQKYLPNLISGKWSGTMNLTEPQCGTDLGLMRTKAEPQDDGSYKISGTKIWISGGEQDLTENTIHLVLAKIPGGPDGIKGVSLFVVPKFLVNEDGSLGERNPAFCGGLESKMGIHGNATCVMNYEGATGWLVGEEHKGMRAMFTMMNEARLGVGIQGLSIAEVAYQNALAFARERLQGRALTGTKNPDGPADPILVHPDVRRMLMEVKAFKEGARALVLWTALCGDLEHRSTDEETKRKSAGYMALLTPIVKAYCTDQGFQAAFKCQQVLGGSGFTTHYPLEQFVRDARIGLIYEGTNGVQALDLVGRKLAQNFDAVENFYADMDAFITQHEGDVRLALFTSAAKESKDRLKEATDWLMTHALSNYDHAGAGSVDYLYTFAYAALSYMWGLMAAAAYEKLDAGEGNAQFYETKIKTGEFFVHRVLPDQAAHLAKVKTGADSVMALEDEAFSL